MPLVPYPPLKSGTKNLNSLEPRQIQHSSNTLHSLYTEKKNTGTNSYGEYIYSIGRIIGKAAEVLKVIPMSALLYRRETSYAGFILRP